MKQFNGEQANQQLITILKQYRHINKNQMLGQRKFNSQSFTKTTYLFPFNEYHQYLQNISEIETCNLNKSVMYSCHKRQHSQPIKQSINANFMNQKPKKSDTRRVKTELSINKQQNRSIKQAPIKQSTSLNLRKNNQTTSQVTDSVRQLFREKLRNIDITLGEIKGENQKKKQIAEYYNSLFQNQILKEKQQTYIIQKNQKRKTIIQPNQLNNFRGQQESSENLSVSQSFDSNSNKPSQISNSDSECEDQNYWSRYQNQNLKRKTIIKKKRIQIQPQNLDLINQTSSKWQIFRTKLMFFLRGVYNNKQINLYKLKFSKASIKKPYIHKESMKFFEMVKFNQIQNVIQILKASPQLVYEIDHALQTALHIAAQKGYAEICIILVNYKCDINAVDGAKKTPLYYSLQSRHYEVMKILIREQVYPWSDEFCEYRQFYQDETIKYCMKIAKRLTILMLLTKRDQKRSVWNFIKQSYLINFELPKSIL